MNSDVVPTGDEHVPGITSGCLRRSALQGPLTARLLAIQQGEVRRAPRSDTDRSMIELSDKL